MIIKYNEKEEDTQRNIKQKTEYQNQTKPGET